MGLVAKAFQDIITFSRASSGTYVNSNGYITNSSVLNYLTYSNQPENAAWTKSNSFVQQNLALYSQDGANAVWQVFGTASKVGGTVVAPDGTLTAYEINVGTTGGAIGAASAIYQSTAATAAATTYTFSAWVIAKTGTVPFRLSGTTSTGNEAGSSDLLATTTAQRFTFTFTTTTAPATQNIAFRAATAGGVVGNMYIWGMQIVQGSVPGDYRATTSAALPCLYADYNGALRARKLSEAVATAVHYAANASSLATASVKYTVSVYAKAAERQWIAVGFYNEANAVAWFNLSTGTVGTVQSNVSSYSIQAIANGWFRCSVSLTVTLANPYPGYSTASADNAYSYTGDGSSGIYIADAQLNDGSSALAYYDTTASAYNAPRFDYDPVTLAAKGLLVEESRANLLLQSNDFQTSWTPTNITRTLNSILSPSGNVDGVKIAATATAATALAQQANVAATSATFSVYVKQGTGATTANTFIIRNVTTLTNLIVGTLNYSTGVFTYTTGSTGVVVTPLANGWWRIALSATAGITSGDLIAGYVGFVGAAATAGDFLYAYQAQLEAGAFATSVIPTTTSQVTRAADVASVNTLSPWYNSVAGTLYTEFQTAPSAIAPQYFAEFDDGTANNAIYNARDNSGNGISQIMTGGASQAALALSTLANVTVGKIAVAYAANDFAASKNGGAAVTDATGTVPTGLNILRLGANVSGGFNANFVNGHLRRITYYPRRLTNAELQTLTTL